MKTLELNQVIKVGKYENCTVYGNRKTKYFHLGNKGGAKSEIITQFLPKQEFIKKFQLSQDGDFPTCRSLEQLTQVVEYLKSFEKPEFKRGDRIVVWNNGDKSKFKRIFITYIQGNKSPFLCVDVNDENEYCDNISFSTAMWDNAEPIQKTKQITKDEIKKAFDCETFEIID